MTVSDEAPSSQDLGDLLTRLDPELLPGRFVYVDLEQSAARLVPDQSILASVRESEGLCAVLRQGEADRLGLEYGFVGAWITLRVRSALDSVGLTALVSTTLAANGIPCNVIAGKNHDHLLVLFERSDEALKILKGPR